MPKRPSPPDEPGKDNAKRARVDDSLAGKLWTAAASAGVAVLARVASPMRPSVPSSTSAVAAAKPPPPPAAGASSSSNAKSTPNGNVASGGNAFLKLTRAAIMSSSIAEVPTQSAASIDENHRAAPTASNDKGATLGEEYPVIPFPKLPPAEVKSRLMKLLSASPWLLLLLFLANTTSAAFVASRRVWHNMIQMEGEMELYALRNELAASQNEVNVLRYRMDALERARDARERMLADDREEFIGLFGPVLVAGAEKDRLTFDERKAWSEKMRLLVANKQLALNEFHKSLSEF